MTDNKDIANTDGTKDIIGNNEGQNAVRILDQLPKDTVEKLYGIAGKCLDKFKNDQNSIDDLGSDVLKNLNSIIDRELDRPNHGNDQSQEINDIVRSMTGDFQSTVKDYDSNTLEIIDKKGNALKQWFQSKMYKRKMKRFDSKPILDRFNIVKAKLTQQNAIIDSNISWGQSMMNENIELSRQLAKFIALIEIVRDNAQIEVDSIKNEQSHLNTTDMKWQENQQKISSLAFIIHKLDIKHTEYLSSLFDAYHTNAQIMNLITISDSIKNKTNHIMNYTLNKMKQVVLQIDFMLRVRDVASMDDSIQRSSESALALQRRMSEDGIPYITSIAESPSITKESIIADASSIVHQNNAYIAEIEEGRRKRIEVERAAVRGMETINESMMKKDQDTVHAMLGDEYDNDDMDANHDESKSIEEQTMEA